MIRHIVDDHVAGNLHVKVQRKATECPNKAQIKSKESPKKFKESQRTIKRNRKERKDGAKKARKAKGSVKNIFNETATRKSWQNRKVLQGNTSWKENEYIEDM